MSNKIQDLEQDILGAWHFQSDISALTEVTDWDDVDPKFMDRVLSMASVQEVRMEKLWQTFEEVVKEYYAMKKKFDDEPEPNKAYEWKHGAGVSAT